MQADIVWARNRIDYAVPNVLLELGKRRVLMPFWLRAGIAAIFAAYGAAIAGCARNGCPAMDRNLLTTAFVVAALVVLFCRRGVPVPSTSLQSGISPILSILNRNYDSLRSDATFSVRLLGVVGVVIILFVAFASSVDLKADVKIVVDLMLAVTTFLAQYFARNSLDRFSKAQDNLHTHCIISDIKDPIERDKELASLAARIGDYRGQE